MRKAGFVLVWFALASVVGFLVLALSRPGVDAHLLAFPMLMLSAGILLLQGASPPK